MKHKNWAWGYLPLTVSEPHMFRRVGMEWRSIEAVGTPVPMGEVLDGEQIVVDTPHCQIEITGADGAHGTLVRLLPAQSHRVR